MVSDWLELDAADSWVRHDSEIVSVLRSPPAPQSTIYEPTNMNIYGWV